MEFEELQEGGRSNNGGSNDKHPLCSYCEKSSRLPRKKSRFGPKEIVPKNKQQEGNQVQVVDPHQEEQLFAAFCFFRSSLIDDWWGICFVSRRRAGLVFHHPPNLGVTAGKLIDWESWIERLERVGGAMVSNIHANFFVNYGQSTSRDMLKLICLVKEKVYQRCSKV